MQEPAEPNEVLTGAEFPTCGDATCGKQVQESPKGAQGWAQRGCLFPTLPMASEGSGSRGWAKEVCSARHIPREEEDLKEKNCTSDPGETVPLQRTTEWLSRAALSYLTDSGGGHLGWWKQLSGLGAPVAQVWSSAIVGDGNCSLGCKDIRSWQQGL